MKAQRLTLITTSVLAAGAAIYFYLSSKTPAAKPQAANDGPAPRPKPNGAEHFRHAIHEAKLATAARQEEHHNPEHN